MESRKLHPLLVEPEFTWKHGVDVVQPQPETVVTTYSLAPGMFPTAVNDRNGSHVTSRPPFSIMVLRRVKSCRKISRENEMK